MMDEDELNVILILDERDRVGISRSDVREILMFTVSSYMNGAYDHVLEGGCEEPECNLCWSEREHPMSAQQRRMLDKFKTDDEFRASVIEVMTKEGRL